MIFRFERLHNLHYEKFADGTVKCIEDEIPFDIPNGWGWTRLGVIFSHNTGKALNVTNNIGTLKKYITTSNVYWDQFVLDTVKEMYFTDDELEKCTIVYGDLLVCEGGDIGRAAIWNKDYSICIQNHLHRLRPILTVCVKFYYYIFYLYKQNDMINGNGIGLQGLSSNRLHSLLVPLPSYKEQNRIVEKIQTYCDMVETIEAEQAYISSLVQSAKSRILDLAIRGKLVSQDPNDEPASVLLERIKTKKEELIKQGKIKREKTESTIFKGEDNSYYCIIDGKQILVSEYVGYERPLNWEWIILKDIASISSGKTPSIDCISQSGTIPYYKVSDMNTLGNDIYMTVNENYINNNYNGSIFEAGSFIFPKNGGAALTNKKRILSVDSAVDLNTGVLTPSKQMNNAFAFYLFSSIDIGKLHKGSTIPTVDAKVIGKLLFALPPLAEQNRIVEAIEKYFAYLDNIAQSLA